MLRICKILIITLLLTSCKKDLVEIVDISIQNHKFIPSTIKAHSNRNIKIRVNNLDDSVEEFESSDFNREKIILGNSTVTINIGSLNTGTYKFFGEFHKDTATGELIIEEEKQ